MMGIIAPIRTAVVMLATTFTLTSAFAADCTLADQIAGTWGARYADGSKACFTYQFVQGGKLLTSAKNCAGGASSNGSGTFSWSVNSACHLLLGGQGNEAEWTVSFNGSDEFTVAGQTTTFIRQ